VAGREEATESRSERQQHGKEREGKEASGKLVVVASIPGAMRMRVNTKELRKKQFVRDRPIVDISSTLFSGRNFES